MAPSTVDESLLHSRDSAAKNNRNGILEAGHSNNSSSSGLNGSSTNRSTTIGDKSNTGNSSYGQVPTKGFNLNSSEKRSSVTSPISPPHTPTSPTMGNSNSKNSGVFSRFRQKVSSTSASIRKRGNSTAGSASASVPASPTTEIPPKEMAHHLGPADNVPQSPTHNAAGRHWDPRATASSFQSTGVTDEFGSKSSFNGPSTNAQSSVPSTANRQSFYDQDAVDQQIDYEIGRIWILNLSLHYRDHSYKEKFFVTYTPPGGKTHRLTISVNYRDAEPGSLEDDLSRMKFQKDKSARIYRTIRSSLSNINFFETATNLRLETKHGGLHINVTEDVNEIIPYPRVEVVSALGCRLIKESELSFESHLSGYVYKVKLDGKTFIKKEIPGPHTVDEFLYEINALHACHESSNVIAFGGVIVDDEEKKVLGLLIDFASRGALIDIIFDSMEPGPNGEEPKGLEWSLREKWAKQIIEGLSEIHEAGYVQGDFTLSNIVVDHNDDVKIIDINRRGCPVGWEPPELNPMIEGFLRIAMYIGVKSDLYQLGMVLWALAYQNDEPEYARQDRQLGFYEPPRIGNRILPPIPEWYQKIVNACLTERPQNRPSAKELLAMLPNHLKSENHIHPSQYTSAQTPYTIDVEPPSYPEGPVPIPDANFPYNYPSAPYSGSHSATYPYPSTSSTTSDAYIKISPHIGPPPPETAESVYSVDGTTVKIGHSGKPRGPVSGSVDTNGGEAAENGLKGFIDLSGTSSNPRVKRMEGFESDGANRVDSGFSEGDSEMEAIKCERGKRKSQLVGLGMKMPEIDEGRKI